MKRFLICCASASLWMARAFAQERAGEAQVGFQQYYLTSGSQTAANASGVTLNLRQYVAGKGLFTMSLAPATSNGRFQTGTSFAEFKQAPWLRQYWTVRAGDTRLAGRTVETPFNNLYVPDISVRGGSIEATHGNRTVGVLYGRATIQAGLRVPLRLITPQTVAGGYIKQQVGERLSFGARVLRYSTDLGVLGTSPQIVMPLDPVRTATTASVSTLFSISRSLRWYNEAVFSTSTRGAITSVNAGPRSSIVTGPIFETTRLTLRGNYIYQADSYLPLLGYTIGDRRGAYGEARARLTNRVEMYGSGSEYRNNLSQDPLRPNLRSVAQSAGVSVSLPSRFTINTTASRIELHTARAGTPQTRSINNQLQVTLSKPLRSHNLRFAWRSLDQLGPQGRQNQQTAEFGDTIQRRWLVLVGQVRGQQVSGLQSKRSVFIRGNAQLTWRAFSAFANVETGNDLANRTLFATSATNSILLGANARAGKDWDLNFEAYRNRLVTELNPESLFVLQNQGVFTPGLLSTFNQWSLYFRVTRRLSWGETLPVQNSVLGGGSLEPRLKGSVEGFVTSDLGGGVEGIPVSLDGNAPVFTSADGRFRFDSVDEGIRRVALALDELPAEFDPGVKRSESVLVRPGKLTRVDFDVVFAGDHIGGRITGPKGVDVRSIAVRLWPTEHYTTPDQEGAFHFYNVRAGAYEVRIAEETLPQYAVLTTANRVRLEVGKGTKPEIHFAFEIKEPVKPVRQINLQPQAVVAPAVDVAAAEPAPVVLKTAVASPAKSGQIVPVRESRVVENQRSAKDASQLYAQGRKLTDAERFEEAVPVLTEALQLDPKNAIAFNTRGFAYLRLRNFKSALADFDAAIRLKPDYRNAYHNRSVTKKKLGDEKGAQLDQARAGGRP